MQSIDSKEMTKCKEERSENEAMQNENNETIKMYGIVTTTTATKTMMMTTTKGATRCERESRKWKRGRWKIDEAKKKKRRKKNAH